MIILFERVIDGVETRPLTALVVVILLILEKNERRTIPFTERIIVIIVVVPNNGTKCVANATCPVPIIGILILVSIWVLKLLFKRILRRSRRHMNKLPQ